MKLTILAAVALIAGGGVSAYAQTTPSNSTTQGTATTPGNGAGMPSASTPAGQISTTGGVAPAGTSAFPSSAGQRAPTPTADSTTTGTTTK